MEGIGMREVMRIRCLLTAIAIAVALLAGVYAANS